MSEKKYDTVAGFEHGRLETSQSLNSEVYFKARANLFQTNFNPKPGLLYIGENGVEYRNETGIGYIQIPYDQIDQLVVQIFLKKIVQKLIFVANDMQLIFTVSQGRKVLKQIAKNLPRNKIVVREGNFTKLFSKVFHKK